MGKLARAADSNMVKPATAATADEPVGGVQSIRRSLAILRALAFGGSGGLRLMDVTRATGMSHATVHRILRVLLEEEIVEQSSQTRRYAIGEQIPLLALARPAMSPLQNAAGPWLQRAAQDIGDTTFLTVRTGLDTICVARHLGSFPVQVLMIETGARRPLGVSSAGIAMLAAMPEHSVQDILQRNKDRLLPYRMVGPRVLRLVSETRERGYAVRQRGLVAGTKAVSVAVCDSQAIPIGALTIAGVDRRLSGDRILEVAAYLVNAAQAIGRMI